QLNLRKNLSHSSPISLPYLSHIRSCHTFYSQLILASFHTQSICKISPSQGIKIGRRRATHIGTYICNLLDLISSLTSTNSASTSAALNPAPLVNIATLQPCKPLKTFCLHQAPKIFIFLSVAQLPIGQAANSSL